MINNKNYPYTLTPIDQESAHFICDFLGLDQPYLLEDIPSLLQSLPAIVLDKINRR
jgi:hypothetical protein